MDVKNEFIHSDLKEYNTYPTIVSKALEACDTCGGRGGRGGLVDDDTCGLGERK